MKRSATKAVLAMRWGIPLAAWLVASAATPAAAAVTSIWNGGDGNWSNAANWSAGIPGSADTASFSNSTVTCNIGSSVSVAAITISKGVTINLNSGSSLTVSGTWTQSLGIFNGGTGTIQIGVDLALSGGTFNSTSGLLKIAGAFNKGGGTFSGGTGRVMLTSTASKALTITGTTTFNNLYINDGLIGYWKLDDSGSTATDWSGYGNDGTISGAGATWNTSVPTGMAFTDSGSLSLSGSSGYMSATASSLPALTGSQTVSFWAYWPSVSGTSTTTQNMVVITDGATFEQIGLWHDQTLGMWNNGGNNMLSPSSTPSSGWHHIAYTSDGTTRKFYLDGGTPTTTTATPYGANPTTVYLGTYNGANELFNGKLDDVRVYNRALSATEISNMASGYQPGASLATQTMSAGATISGDLVIASGTLAASSNNLSVGGNWWNYGVFSGTGTVTFNGGVGTVASILTNGQMPGALTISGAGSWTVVDGSAITLALTGSYTQSNGTFTAGPGLLNIAGAFSKSAGTFNGGGGQVMLTSSMSKAFGAAGTTSFSNLTINDGLVGYWKLDDSGAGNTTATDASGYGNNGTLSATGATWQTDVPTAVAFADSGSLSLNGSAGYVTLGTTNLPATNAAQTISVWAKPANTTQNGDMVVLKGSGTGVQLKVQTGTVRVTSIGGTTLISATAPSAGNWHHIAYTYDGASHQTLYVDGTATTATAANQTGAATLAYLGTYSPLNELYSGSLDDVRVYNRVLSAAEINSLYLGNQPATSVATQTLSGSPTVTGDLTIASGALAIGTNTLSVGGNWWNYGGVFTATYGASGGTVAFTGTGTGNYILPAGQLFPQVNITGSGTWTLAAPMDVDPTRTVSLTAGQLNGSSKTLRGTIVGSGGTFTPSTGTVVADSSTTATMAATTYNNLRIEDPTETNLVGYWKLDEGQGASTYDWTGSGRTATLVGGSKWTSTVPGSANVEYYDPYAMSFDGSTSYLDVTSVPTATNSSYTACAWVYYNNLSGNQTVISAAGPNAGSVGAFYLQKAGQSAGITHFTMGAFNSDSTGSAAYWTTGTVNVQLSTWYHVCGIYTGSVVRLYVNGAQDGTDQTVIGGSFAATGHTYIGGAIYNGNHQDWTSGIIDDVRFYSGVLTTAQIKQLANGRYANTGGAATFQLGGNLSASGTFDVDSGVLAPNSHTLTANSSLTIRNGGTLSLSSSADVVGVSGTLTVDGTLTASNALATIQGVSGGNYAFKVGSTATATPTLNINGLTVTKTDANGMWINSNTSAVTTFTRFDSIAFKSGTAGAGSTLLKIYAPTLYLSSNGCSFDANLAASTTYAVTLTGNGTGSGAGPRAIFGSATCATNASSGICATTEKSDDDSTSDGVADHPSTNGAVVQFVRAAQYTAGTLVGNPTAAFDWNTFVYYSTYAAFHNASGGTNDMVYILNETGSALTSWTDPTAGETIMGTPQWITPTSGGTHYLYVAVNGSAANTGKIYRLIDTGTGSSGTRLSVDSTWATSGASPCSCTITSGLSMDANNLYWAATTASAQVLEGIKQSNGAVIGSGWPVTTPVNVTASSPTLVTQSGTTTLYLGGTADLLSLAVTGTSFLQNTSPGTITGRVSFGTSALAATSGTRRLYAGDSAGTMWAFTEASFATPTTPNYIWTYAVGSGNAITNNTYDYLTDTVQFGTAGGKIVVLNGAGGAANAGSLLNTTYPLTLDASDPITASPLYYSGVLVVGTTKGKLYFLDRNTNLASPNGVATIATYSFGPTESVSTIAFDPDLSRYMVSTSSTASDGRIYYFDLVADPTASFK